MIYVVPQVVLGGEEGRRKGEKRGGYWGSILIAAQQKACIKDAFFIDRKVERKHPEIDLRGVRKANAADSVGTNSGNQSRKGP